VDAAIKGLGSVFKTVGDVDDRILGFILVVLLVVWAISKAFD
jgi:hypothetical protein